MVGKREDGWQWEEVWSFVFFFVFFVLFCFYAERRESNGIELKTLEKLRAERLFLEKSVKT